MARTFVLPQSSTRARLADANPAEASSGISYEARELQIVGLRLIGVYFLTLGVLTLVDIAVRVLDALISSQGGHVDGLSLVAPVVNCLLAAGLVLGARGIAGFIDRVRGAGLQPDERGWKSTKS